MATRLVGIDYGLARIGVAISDERKIIASPAFTLHAEKKLEATAAKLAEELNKHQKEFGYTVESLIVGLPLLMSGKHGLQADEVKHFAELLRTLLPFQVVLWDERLTTVMAERSMREGHMSRKKRAKSIDTVAAVIILQSYLDRRNFENL